MEKSFTEEPLKKYPRLTGSNCEELLILENELKSKMSDKIDDAVTDENPSCCDHMQQTDILSHREDFTQKNDKGVMVGDTGIAELKAECQRGEGKFEIIQDVGYSSETSAHLSNDEKLDSPENHCVKNVESMTILSPTAVLNRTPDRHIDSPTSKLYLAPDKYPSVSLKAFNFFADDKPLFNSKYGNCKAVPDTFYKVTSVEDEVFDDSIDSIKKEGVPSECTSKINDLVETVSPKIAEVSNEISRLNIELDTNTINTAEKDTTDKKDNFNNPPLPSEHHQFVNSSKRNKKNFKSCVNSQFTKSLKPNELWKKSARVREWLNTCQSADDGTSDDNFESNGKCSKDYMCKTADSSCDASGECTTTESDSEKSNTSDVNNSVALSQSFTG